MSSFRGAHLISDQLRRQPPKWCRRRPRVQRRVCRRGVDVRGSAPERQTHRNGHRRRACSRPFRDCQRFRFLARRL